MTQQLPTTGAVTASRGLAGVMRHAAVATLAVVLLVASATKILEADIRGRLAVPLAAVLKGAVPATHPLPPARVDGIIVLGGYHARTPAAIAIAKQYPDAFIVLSGPSPVDVRLALSDPAIAQRITIDWRARTTYENAVYSKDVVQPHRGSCWLLVTSALHMPRALASFEAVGFDVWPHSVADIPTVRSELASTVWHELLGLLAYRATGRTRNIYPVGAGAPQGCATDTSVAAAPLT